MYLFQFNAILSRTNMLLEKVAAAVEQSAFYSALWGSILTSPAVRLPGVTFVLLHLNRKLSMEDQLYVMGSDIELMVHEKKNHFQRHLSFSFIPTPPRYTPSRACSACVWGTFRNH